MSDDTPATSSRKDKKAQRDAERAAKFKKGSKKDKPEPPALPEDRPDDVAEEPQAAVKPEPKSKKRKREETTDEAPTESKPTPKSKKRKAAPAEGEQPSKKRFIVFVGNLPYSTTDQSLEKHFEKLRPFNLRHRTDPQTKKSKGFAFVEFEDYDRLKTCLQIFHHSYFDPEDPDAKDPGDTVNMTSRDKKKIKGRRINVQLSAGGGGSNSEARKEKIKAKNERLDGQRTRRAEAERKEKAKKQKAEGEKEPPQREEPTGGMHPSRLARLQ